MSCTHNIQAIYVMNALCTNTRRAHFDEASIANRECREPGVDSGYAGITQQFPHTTANGAAVAELLYLYD